MRKDGKWTNSGLLRADLGPICCGVPNLKIKFCNDGLCSYEL